MTESHRSAQRHVCFLIEPRFDLARESVFHAADEFAYMPINGKRGTVLFFYPARDRRCSLATSRASSTSRLMVSTRSVVLHDVLA